MKNQILWLLATEMSLKTLILLFDSVWAWKIRNDVNWLVPYKQSIKTSEKEGWFLPKSTVFYITIIFM